MARQRIPGIPADAEIAINELVKKQQDRLDLLEKGPTAPAVITTDFTAREGQFLRIQAPATGLNITLPKANTSNRNARVTFSFETIHPVTIRCIGGVVNRESLIVSATLGTFEAISDGQNGWSVGFGISASGSPTGARYILGAAHGSLPNASVATDSTEIDVTATAGGPATWVLRNASIVLAKLQDLTGLSVLGRAANSAGVMAAITATAARQVLRVNDAGTALAWGNPIDVQDDNVLQGAVHTLDFTSTTSITATAAVASGEAVVSFQRAALTGAIAASANSNATLFDTNASGAGLTGGGTAILAVGAGTHITVNANDVAVNLATLVPAIDSPSVVADGTVLERAALTGAVTAAQDDNATIFGATASGAGLTGGGTAVLAVGAGTHITVNADDVAVNLTTLVPAIDSPSVVADGTVLERAALTGAISAAQDSNATLFAGIRDNGASENDRTNLNFVNTAEILLTVTDDVAGDELEIRASLAAMTEVEETGAGPHNNYSPGAARHIMASNVAGVFTGVDLGTFRVGEYLVISHQGTGYTQLNHNDTGSTTAGARFFNGLNALSADHLRIYDNQAALYQYLDVTAGGTTALRWVLLNNPPKALTVIPESVGGTFTDHALDAFADVWSFTATSTISSVAGGSEGRCLTIRNDAAAGSGVLVTVQQFTGGSTGNRFLLPNATQVVLRPGDALEVQYQSSRWRSVSVNTVAVRKNSTGTVFSQPRINLIEGSNVTLTVADDATNGEVDVTIAATGTTLNGITVKWGGGVDVYSSINTLDFINGDGIPPPVITESPTGELNLQFNVDVSDFTGTGLEDDGSENIRISSSAAGAGLTGGSGSALSVVTSNAYHTEIDTATNAVIFRKNVKNHFWYEEFDNCVQADIGTATLGTALNLGTTNWFARTSGSTGFIRLANGEHEHPGLLNLETGTTDNSTVWIYRGSTNESATVCPYQMRTIRQTTFIARLSSATSSGFWIGLMDSWTSIDHGAYFVFDTDTDTTIRCYTESSGVQTMTDSNVAPGTGFNKYEIVQDTVGTIVFKIDGSTVATHSTNVPSTATVTTMIGSVTRTTAAKTLCVDYVDFESHNMGTRTS